MKNKIKKMITAIMLSAVAFSGAAAVTSTYAWWNTLTKTEKATVLLGEGLETQVTATVVAPTGKALVPEGTITDKDTQVDVVNLEYAVKLSKTVSTALTLSVVASNVLIGGDATNEGLVNIAITAPASLTNTIAQIVTVKVTLTEPSTEAIYNTIINKNITFDLTFTVALA